MMTKNDVTGDLLKSKPPSESYRNNYDLIFRKKKDEQDKNGDKILSEKKDEQDKNGDNLLSEKKDS